MASRGIRPRFRGLSPCGGQVAYVLLTRAPVAGGRKQASAPAAPRLACVKPVASVHPEPGSNSPLLLCCFFFFQKDSCRHAPGQRSGRLYPARHPLFDSSDQELTGVSVPLFVTLCSCTSLAFVYCNTFNVLSSLTPAPGGCGEKRCKVTDCFPFRQIFRQLFFKASRPVKAGALPARHPKQEPQLRDLRPRKRVQNYTFPRQPPNFPAKIFRKTMPYDSFLTSIH